MESHHPFHVRPHLKYINGASDLIAGAICADKQFIQDLMNLYTGRVMLPGRTMDPRVAFDVIQRLPHLPIRIREHSRRASAMDVLQNEEKFGLLAVSLGYFDTLISCSGSSTSSEIDIEDQQKMGLTRGLLRIALGYTGSLDVRLEQMKRAVQQILYSKVAYCLCNLGV